MGAKELAQVLHKKELAEMVVQKAARIAELEAALSSADDVAEEYGDESDQYRHKLAAAEERIAELKAQLAQTWQPLADGEEVRCTCGAETCETVATVDEAR